jgi:hypothetical protein
MSDSVEETTVATPVADASVPTVDPIENKPNYMQIAADAWVKEAESFKSMNFAQKLIAKEKASEAVLALIPEDTLDYWGQNFLYTLGKEFKDRVLNEDMIDLPKWKLAFNLYVARGKSYLVKINNTTYDCIVHKSDKGIPFIKRHFVSKEDDVLKAAF